MDHVLIKAITRAHRAGTEITIHHDELLVRGTPPGPDLADHRIAVRALLTSDACAGCGRPHWIREHGTAIPWCRPCANRRGRQLLRHEQPHLVDHREVA
jgi:hypothetical protein